MTKLEERKWKGPGSAIMKEDAQDFAKRRVKILEKEIEKRDKEIARQVKTEQQLRYDSNFYYKSKYYMVLFKMCLLCSESPLGLSLDALQP
jgi:hypothetical protein